MINHYHVKLPSMHKQQVPLEQSQLLTTVDGPKLSYALQNMLNQYPGFKVAMEPFGEYANVDKDGRVSLLVS